MDYFKLCYIPLIKQFKTQVTKTCEIKVWFSNVVCWRTDWQLTKLYEIGYMWDKIVEITGRCIWFLYHGHLKFGRDSINEKTKSQIWLFGHRKWAWKKWIETLTWFIIFRTVYIVIFSDVLRFKNYFSLFYFSCLSVTNEWAQMRNICLQILLR